MITNFRRLCLLPVLVLLMAACTRQPAPPVAEESYASPYATPPVVAAPVTIEAPRPDAMGQIPVDKRVKVALLLPITGRNSDLGRALQDAATLSLFDKYASLTPEQNRVRVELKTYDAGDTPEQAREAAEQAIADGSVMLIGPVFSDATAAVAIPARAAGVPVISFSNSPGVAAPGVYIFGFSPEAQTRRVVEFATSQGRVQLAALTPNNPYGQTVMEAARQQITDSGAVLVREARFSPQGVGLDIAMQTLIPPGEPAAFDSLFLPEAGPPLDTILRTLEARGLRNRGIQLLGTGLWDDVLLITRVNLEGAWFATSPPHLTNAYETRFRNVYRYQPPRLSSLAYDAVALAVTIIATGRPLTEKTFTTPGGFSGPANGIFRFKKNGLSERGLVVLEVRGGGFDVVSPAPVGFVP